MAQPNWWDQYEKVGGPSPTLKERDTEAGIGQSEASAENSRENAETERQMRAYKVQKAAAEAKDAQVKAQLAAEEEENKRKGRVAQTSERRAQIMSALDNLTNLEKMVKDSYVGMGTGSIVGQEDFLSGEKWGGVSGLFNTRANNVAGSVQMVQGDLINQIRQQMQDQGVTVGVRQADTEKEAARLAASIANLAQTQDEKEFLVGVQRARDYYNRRLNEIEGKSPAGDGEDDDPGLDGPGGSAGGGAGGGGTGGGGTGGGAGGGTPTDPRLQSQIDKMLRQGASFDEINTFALDNNADPIDRQQYAAARDFLRKNPKYPGSLVDVIYKDQKAEGDSSIDTSGILRRLGEGVGSMVEAAGSVPGVFIDPFMSLVYKYKGYNQPYDTGEVLRGAIGLPDNPNPTNDLLIKGATSGLAGAGLARGAASLARPGALKTALTIFGATPVRDAVAGFGAAGASELARRAGFGVPGQVVASLLGGIGSYGAASGVYRAAVPHVQTPVGAAAERMNVDLLPADTGGATTRILTNAGLASPFSANTISKAATRSQDSIARAAGRVARDEGGGDIPYTDEAGEFLRGAAKRYNAKTQDIGKTMYRQAFKAAGDVRLPAPNAVKTIDGFLKDLRANPETNAGAINDLLKLRRDLTRGQTAEQMHQLRSDISGGVYDGKLRSSAEQGRMKAVRGALSQDLLGYFDNNFMPGIANRIRKADKYWEQRVEHIDQVLQPIIGKEGYKGGEDVVRTVENMARGKAGGNVRLGRMLNSMTEDERKQVRATLIDRIGRPAEDAGFSSDTFFRNWQKMTPQAKEGLFKDGKLRQSLDDIASLAAATRESKNIAEHGAHKGLLTGNLGLQLAWAVAHPPSFIGGGAAQYITGKLLSSPKFAKWLANAPASESPAAQRKALDQLGVLAAQDLIIRRDALALQQHLEESLSRSPGLVNAEEEGDGGREPPEE